MSRPLRILFVTDAFPPHSYGSGWSTYHLARGLRAQGHDVRIVLAQPSLRMATTEYDGFPVWRARPGARAFNPALFAVNGLGPGRIVRRLVRSWSPDIVHAQHINALLVASHAARALPLVVTVRDHWPVCFYGTALAAASCPGCLIGTCSPCNVQRGSVDASRATHLLKRAVMRGMLRQRQNFLSRAAAVIAASDAMHRELRAVVLPTRLHTIPNAVDRALFSPGDTLSLDTPARFFLYVGKLSAHKGADLLPDIACHLGADAPPILVVGDGPLEESLRSHEPDVRVLGRLPNEAVIALMQRAIALITPARWPEPLSRTHLEALAAGCPIVATDTGGTGEVVADGETGFLTAVGDVEAMAAHLRTLASDDAVRARMTIASRERAARLFDLEAVTNRHLAVYRAAMARDVVWNPPKHSGQSSRHTFGFSRGPRVSRTRSRPDRTPRRVMAAPRSGTLPRWG
ncbi:MAG: glycosyltransferase family 4 protein [Chloroflexota bacterium]|nr:glycosyltransferase family 4 protein [Chloroflexota bacterium]